MLLNGHGDDKEKQREREQKERRRGEERSKGIIQMFNRLKSPCIRFGLTQLYGYFTVINTMKYSHSMIRDTMSYWG